MVRLALERIGDLFALAEVEARGPDPGLADRYVQLARRIGMRYNVRLLPEYGELYCRGCSRYWVEGRTVRTRLRYGRRVRVCLLCGRSRRVRYRSAAHAPDAPGPSPLRRAAVSEVALAAEERTSEDAPGRPSSTNE